MKVYAKKSLVKMISAGLVCMTVAASTFATIYEPDEYLNSDSPEKRPGEDPDFLPNEAEERYFENVVKEEYGFDLNNANEKAEFTLGKWKEVNGFDNPLLPHLQEYYFNSADLGLARDMTCIRQWVEDNDLRDIQDLGIDELSDDQNQVLEFFGERGEAPMACFVSNRGFIGGNSNDGFNGALNDDEPFATVAMEYWPKRVREGRPNGVRFFVFGGPQVDNDPDTGVIIYLEGNFFTDGSLGYDQEDVNNATAIKLDNGNGHSQPGICLSCHGGELNRDGEILTDDAPPNFIPFYVQLMEFPGPEFVADPNNVANGFFRGFVDREEAVDKFNQMNAWIYYANQAARRPNDAPNKVESYLRDVYGERYLEELSVGEHSIIVDEPDEDYIPPEFDNNDAQRDFAKNVYIPFCEACHDISSEKLEANDFFSDSGQAFRYMCDEFFKGPKRDGTEYMPEAEVNDRNMRRHAEFVKAHIARSTGNVCEYMPTLVDFETGTNLAEEVDVLALNVFPLSDSAVVRETAVGDFNGNGVENEVEFSTKRSLQIRSGERTARIRIEEEDFGISGSNKNTTRLSTLSFSYFLENEGDQVIIEFVRNDNGNEVIVDRDTIVLQNPTIRDGRPLFLLRELSNNIPPNTVAAIITMRRTNNDNNSIVELDDMLVEFDYIGRKALSEITKVVDFEYNNGLTDLGGLVNHELSENVETVAGEDADKIETCRKQRINDIGGNVTSWERSTDYKVLRDPGKKSYSTTTFGCAQDLMSFEIPLDGSAEDRVNVSFDYRSNPDATLYLTVYDNGKADPQDLHIEASQAPHFGRFRLTNVSANATLSFTYAYKTRTDIEDISADFDDLFGASIDNVRVIEIE